jgi:hypothetical protein
VVGRLRAAAAGAGAAALWAAQEPLDRKLFGCDYSDVAVLGKAVARESGWRPAGWALHLANGALFGLAYRAARQRLDVEPRRLALGLALAEHAVTYPLAAVVVRHHPARGEPGIPLVLPSGRAFAQATWRHALFGLVLGRLAGLRA